MIKINIRNLFKKNKQCLIKYDNQISKKYFLCNLKTFQLI